MADFSYSAIDGDHEDYDVDVGSMYGSEFGGGKRGVRTLDGRGSVRQAYPASTGHGEGEGVLPEFLSVPLSPPRVVKASPTSPPGASPHFHPGPPTAQQGGASAPPPQPRAGEESLLDSLLPAAGCQGDPVRLQASLSALSVAFRQLELVSAHLNTELSQARECAQGSEALAERAVREAAEAGEEAGFLRHCLERLQKERGVNNPLALTSLPLLRGEALHAAMERLSECESEARAARAAAAGVAREKDIVAWVGSGLGALRAELDRLVKERVAEGHLAGARVAESQAVEDAAVGEAEEARREAREARRLCEERGREVGVEREQRAAAEALLKACQDTLTLKSQRLEWAEEAVGVLRGEVGRRDALIAAQGGALVEAYKEIEAGERGKVGALGTLTEGGGGGGGRVGGGVSNSSSSSPSPSLPIESGASASATASAEKEALVKENAALLAQIATLKHALEAVTVQAEEDATEKSLLKAQLQALATAASSGGAPSGGGGGAATAAAAAAAFAPHQSTVVEGGGGENSIPAPSTPPSTPSALSQATILGAPRKPVRINLDCLDMSPVPMYSAAEEFE